MRRSLVAICFFLVLSLAGRAGIADAQDMVLLGRGLDWWKLDPAAVTFLCLPDRRPDWCANAEAGIRPPPPPEPPPPPPDRRTSRGSAPPQPPPPPKSVSDEDWQALVGEMTRRRARTVELATMEKRAFEDGDADALEMLGYIYATGAGPLRDYAAAYQYYGLAVMQGRESARTNLDELWRFLSEPERQFVRFRFERAYPPSPAGPSSE